MSRKIEYFHLYHILACWLYQLSILFARLRDWLFTRPEGSFHFFVRSDDSYFDPNCRLIQTKFSRLQSERADTPSAAFLRIIHRVHILHISADLNVFLDEEIQHFWRRGITGADKPDYFGGKWHIKDLPDPREKLGNDPPLCAIAASTAEHMVEIFNWRIGMGIRRDLRMLMAGKPYWDKNLMPCMMESAPKWCDDVGPVQLQTVVDSDDTPREMLESKAITLSPSF